MFSDNVWKTDIDFLVPFNERLTIIGVNLTNSSITEGISPILNEVKLMTTTSIPSDLHKLGLVQIKSSHDPSTLNSSDENYGSLQSFAPIRPIQRVHGFSESYYAQSDPYKQKTHLRRTKRTDSQAEKEILPPNIEFLRKDRKNRKKHRRTKDSVKSLMKNKMKNRLSINPTISTTSSTSSSSTSTSTTTTTHSTENKIINVTEETRIESINNQESDEDISSEFKWQPFTPELINYLIALLVFAIR